jgi:hypothetical protein
MLTVLLSRALAAMEMDDSNTDKDKDTSSEEVVVETETTEPDEVAQVVAGAGDTQNEEPGAPA